MSGFDESVTAVPIGGNPATSSFGFDYLPGENVLETLYKNYKDAKEQLLQYNLDQSLSIHRFRIVSGSMNVNSSTADYEECLAAFISSATVMRAIGATGEATLPVDFQHVESLKLQATSMEMFDRLSEVGIVGPGGQIRGCFDETFDGIIVSAIHYTSITLRTILVIRNNRSTIPS